MESFSRKDIKLINAQAFKYIFREREGEREEQFLQDKHMGYGI